MPLTLKVDTSDIALIIRHVDMMFCRLDPVKQDLFHRDVSALADRNKMVICTDGLEVFASEELMEVIARYDPDTLLVK